MKFNKKQTIEEMVASDPDLTQNHEGGTAFKQSPKLELFKLACTALFEDKYYEPASNQHKRMKDLIQQCPREFVLRLAMFARNEMNLRTAPIAMLGEASRLPRGETEPAGLLRSSVPHICRRADEPAELLAYMKHNLLGESKQKMPYGILRGLSDTLNNFNAYQLRKWDKPAEFSLKDVIRIVHPKPRNEEQSLLFKQAIAKELPVPETWESYISANGSSAETWNEIAPKMPVMALLRNLRNFEKNHATEAIDYAIKQFKDPAVIQNSKQFPYRWYSALNHVTDSRLLNALSTAMDLSLQNVPRFKGRTGIFIDLSGSMSNPMSKKSTVTLLQVAALMGAMACHLSPEDYVVGAFGDHYAEIPLLAQDSILTNMLKITQARVGHRTHAHLCFQSILQKKQKFDRIFLFSDMQCYTTRTNPYGGNDRSYDIGKALQTSWMKYKRQVSPEAILYSCDLAGHATGQFPEDENGVVELAGWSDQIFNYVRLNEDQNNVLDRIDRYRK